MVNFLFGVCTGILIGLGLNHLIEENVNYDIDKLLAEKREKLKMLQNQDKHHR